MRRDVFSSWWKFALQASEVAWTAPFVIQQRCARLLVAPRPDRAADRREAVRMVSKRSRPCRGAVRDVAAHSGLCSKGVGAPMDDLRPHWRASAAAATRGLRDSALLARRALQPVRRRVNANASACASAAK